MKNTLHTSCPAVLATLLLAGSGSAAADWHLGLGMAPNARGGQLDGLEYQDTSYLTLWLGRLRQHSLGWYVGGGLSPALAGGQPNTDLHYGYGILNGGTTLGLTGSLGAYAGFGYSLETGQQRQHRSFRQTSATRDSVNLNAGLLYRFNPAWGGNIGFDSASDALSIGFTRRL